MQFTGLFHRKELWHFELLGKKEFLLNENKFKAILQGKFPRMELELLFTVCKMWKI